jgi:beta-galactosidase
MRVYVNGDMTVDRPASDMYSVTPRTDDEGQEYWETRLVDGSSAFILRAGDTVDRIQVEVRSGDLPPAGHEIHTIPADVELLQPTAAQLESLRTRAIADLPRMIGADISFLPQLEANGAIFTDGGEERDAVRILADNGFNFIRLRIFVNPENPGGYSPGEGFAGLEHTKEMARRIDAAGMGFLLDFHYSDYWADPQQQNKPMAWRNLDFVGLKAAMQRYTTQVILELAEQGTPPDMVQVGNEINHGLLWPEGHIQNLDNLAELLQAGIRGVRDANPDIPVMLHIALGGQNEESRFWLDNMIARDVQFDLIGLSYYPRWHATLDDLKANLHDLVDRYGLPVNVVEYSPFKAQVHEIVFGLPDGLGNGTAIWEPLRSFFDEQTRAPTADLRLYTRLSDRYLGSS